MIVELGRLERGAGDGVRVGVLQYENADIDGSPDNLAIKAAVTGKLGKMVKGTPTVTVECIKADSEAVIGCTRAAGDSGVEVTVTSSRSR